MSSTNAIGDFDLNTVKLRKKLEFPDGTIQDTAYTGDGSETLAEVLSVGDNALGQNIMGVGTLEVTTQINLTPTGNTINFLGEINQVAVGVASSSNQLRTTIINSGVGSSPISALEITDNTGINGLYVIPNALDNNYNPIVNVNDVALVSATGSKSMAVCCDSATTNGVRITDTSVTIGAGGAADTPTVNTTYNSSAGQMVSTTTLGAVFQSSTIEPQPTLAVKDVPSNQQMYLIPKANVANYNPITLANNQQLVAGKGDGTANTQTLELTTASTTASGIRIAPASVMIGAGGAISTPSNSITFSATGTVETGQSHQFSNGVAQYDAAGQANKIIPSCPSTGASVVPGFEFITFRVTGNANQAQSTILLNKNVTATTNYAVFPSVYYGFEGSAGTYNALETSGAMTPIVISGITATQFDFHFNKQTAQNVNIEVQFLVVYQLSATDYPKSYS